MDGNRSSKLLREYVRGDVKLCNCAACGVVLLGDSHRADYEATPESARDDLPGLVAGRIRGRPHCLDCLSEHRVPQLAENLTPRQAAKLN